MGVTFLIGNGFDLNLGLKTRYTDMYDSYVKSKSKSGVIARFKRDLQNEEHNHYENWSDFEMGMAKYAFTFSAEEDFIMCIRDFKAYMVEWLKNEEKPFLENIWLALNVEEEILNSIGMFHYGLTPNNRYLIEESMLKNKICNCDFISFNYTRVLDAFLSEVSGKQEVNDISFRISEDVVHIHGDLYNDVVLGVDNRNQINTKFNITQKTKMAFVKPEFNQNFDYRRVDKAIELINKNGVVCTFGLSLGESDRMWLDILKEWVLADEKHHWVYYVFDENVIPSYNYDVKIEREEEIKEMIYQKLNFTKEEIDVVKARIHIPISYKIFEIKDVLKEKELQNV